MFRIEFTLRTSVIQRYTMVLPAALLVLAFLGQVNKLNFFGAPYAIGCISLGRIDHINNALLLSGLGFIMDMFFLLFHKSDSSWLYIKAIQFIMRLIICIFELACLTAVYCYVKQEQTIRDNKNNLNWIEKQLNKIMPNSEQSEKPSTSKEPLNEPSTSKEPLNEPLTSKEPLNEPSTSKLPSSPLNSEPIEDETTAADLVDTPKKSLKEEITDKLLSNINEKPVDEADLITDKDIQTPDQTPGTDDQTPGTDDQPAETSNVNQQPDKS